MSTPLPEIGDHPELAVRGCLTQFLAEVVGDCRNQDFRGTHRPRDLIRRHQRVVEVEPCVDSSRMPDLDRIPGSLRGDRQEGFFFTDMCCSS